MSMRDSLAIRCAGWSRSVTILRIGNHRFSLGFWLIYLCAFDLGFADGYRKTGEGWEYWWRGPDAEHARNVVGADSVSFRTLGHQDYAADKNLVYFRGEKLPGAEPSSFKEINRDYWADALGVYCEGVKMDGADPNSFTLLKEGSVDGFVPWSKDKNRCFHRADVVPGAEPGTFVPIGGGAWARDQKHYFLPKYNNVVVVPCDYASMTILKGLFAKDKDQVFFGDQVIAGADVASFTPIANVTAKDRFRTYWGSKAVVFVSEAHVLPLGPVMKILGTPNEESADDGTDTLRWKTDSSSVEVLADGQFVRRIDIDARGQKVFGSIESALEKVKELCPGWQWTEDEANGPLAEDEYRSFWSTDKKLECLIMLHHDAAGYACFTIVKDATINMPKHWDNSGH